METKTDKSVAIEILRQLGGNRFIVMTGAKNFACTNNSFLCQIPMKKDRISHIKITLTPLDLYDIEFISCWGNEIKIISTVTGVYNDMLQDIISDKTGLRLTL